MKQKVIALLEPYRDKTLSFGCEVEINKTGGGGTKKVSILDSYIGLGEEDSFSYFNNETGKMGNSFGGQRIRNIIGHPLTHADLLRALEDKLNQGFSMRVNIEGELCCYLKFPDDNPIKIPLNHRTIEDIPGTDPMWEQLLEVLSK